MRDSKFRQVLLNVCLCLVTYTEREHAKEMAARVTGQFERTLIVCDDAAFVSNG